MSWLRAAPALADGSYYAATTPQRRCRPTLEADLDADVAIVGGGLAGVSAAIELADRGLRVVLLEARTIGAGASGRNGGQAIHGLACDQSEIEAQLGADEARRVWAMSIEALALIRGRCARFGIDCDWRDGFLGVAVGARKAVALQRWHARIARIDGDAMRWIGPRELPQWIASPRFHGGVHDPRSGHLHPLKYCVGLADAAQGLGVQVFEQSPAVVLERPASASAACVVRTARGSVRARQVLLAGNVYLQQIAPQLAPELGARIMPVGTYIACSAPLGAAVCDALIPSRSAVCDTNVVLDYFRPTADHRMLYGGRVSYSTVTPRHLADSMRARMAATFPQLADTAVDFAWGGFVDVSMNRAPDFGRLPGPRGAASNVYYLQGFSGHGLALTGLAGQLVAEAMTGDAGRFDTFARLRHRRFPGGRWLRTPALVLGMAYHRIKDVL